MTVYLDIVFLENLIINYIILIATGIINKVKTVHTRIFISAIIGAIYTVIIFVRKQGIETSVIPKIILSIIMVGISFAPKSFKKFLKQLLIFYLTTFAFGGVTFFLMYVVKPSRLVLNTGIYPIKMAVLGGVLGFIIICLSFKVIKNGLNKKNMLCKLELDYEGKTITITAMIDSGNLLKEPFTNTPVVVVESKILSEILPKSILDNTDKILHGNLNNNLDNKYISKLKIIPFTSIGKENGMLLGIKIDGVKIFVENETIKIDNVIIGIYERNLSKSGNYKALIGLDLIENSL